MKGIKHWDMLPLENSGNNNITLGHIVDYFPVAVSGVFFLTQYRMNIFGLF